jgi:hypothetical protein
MVKTCAVQQHDGRQARIEFATAGRDEYFSAIDVQLHGSSPLRDAERLPEVVDDIG